MTSLREQFKVLQVVKHRVQEQVLRTSTHDFGQLLRTFRRTPQIPHCEPMSALR